MEGELRDAKLGQQRAVEDYLNVCGLTPEVLRQLSGQNRRRFSHPGFGWGSGEPSNVAAVSPPALQTVESTDTVALPSARPSVSPSAAIAEKSPPKKIAEISPNPGNVSTAGGIMFQTAPAAPVTAANSTGRATLKGVGSGSSPPAAIEVSEAVGVRSVVGHSESLLSPAGPSAGLLTSGQKPEYPTQSQDADTGMYIVNTVAPRSPARPIHEGAENDAPPIATAASDRKERPSRHDTATSSGSDAASGQTGDRVQPAGPRDLAATSVTGAMMPGTPTSSPVPMSSTWTPLEDETSSSIGPGSQPSQPSDDEDVLRQPTSLEEHVLPCTSASSDPPMEDDGESPHSSHSH